MTKQDIVEALSKKMDSSKAEAERCLNVILDEITKDLSRGKDVVLTGFGKFSVKKRKARQGRNPKTGASIKIPAMKVVRFKVGKALKDSVK